ncbi:MAG: prepilin-type N-terminal cleavage/methylation domain-containing protein [Acidobacteria bacterium]|nr:prepilin-type N-terminal cleavage/methylation domain-containing protein [Acidobacteriota bacterium]
MMKQTINKRPVPPSQAGLSVIEVLISIVVLAVGLVSVVGISAYVSRMNSTSNNINILAAVAQDEVDRLRSAIWTQSTEDPTIAVGGTLPTSSYGSVSSAITEAPSTGAVGASMGQSTSSQTAPYTYTLDTSTNHHATVSNTPVGNVEVYWQVRQGSPSALRYVTIRVVQSVPSANMRQGFTVTTILSKG